MRRSLIFPMKKQFKECKTFSEAFDEFVDKMQTEVEAKEREDFSARALELAKNPYKVGQLPADTPGYATAAYRGTCGDEIRFHVSIQDAKLKEIVFEADGCATSVIAASQVVLLMENKSVKDAETLTDHQILEALGRFPQKSYHCVTLANTALKMTIDDFKKRNSFS